MKTNLFYFILLLLALLMMLPLAKQAFIKHRRKTTYRFILENLQSLYADTNPFDVALNANKYRLDNVEYLYGEVLPVTLLDLVALLPPKKNQIFYDLGSGAGKALLAMKLCYPSMQVKGIEQVLELHTLALEKYHQYLKVAQLQAADFEIHHINQNMIDYPFEDADIVFINATAFEATWQPILDKLRLLKAGTKIIITSKTLPEDGFTKQYQGMEPMSWGLTSTYIYEKKA